MKGKLGAEFISVHPDIRLTSIRFYPDIQLIYPDSIRISRILSGYPKLSGYPVNLSGYPGYLLKYLILRFVNDNLIEFLSFKVNKETSLYAYFILFHDITYTVCITVLVILI